MHVALGYRWFPTAAGFHIERALRDRAHEVTYVGLGTAQKPGYAGSIPVDRIVGSLDTTPNFFLWIDPAGRYFPPGIENLSIPTACYLIDVHLGDWRLQAAKFFDAVFVAQRDFVAPFRRAVGHNQVFWLPLAAAVDVHGEQPQARDLDVAFVGNVARAHANTARGRRLQLLSERYRTNDFYRQYSPSEVGAVYSQARIVFNTSIAGDVTMRIFEGTAAGALVVTDRVANGLDEIFAIGEEVVVFEDDADLLRRIDALLEDDERRVRIARAGQARTLAQHTYAHRADEIVSVITRSSFQRSASMRRASPASRYAARRQVYIHLHMLDALLDLAKAQGYGPLRRLWSALPCLARRVLL